MEGKLNNFIKKNLILILFILCIFWANSQRIDVVATVTPGHSEDNCTKEMYDKINQVEKEGYEVVGELETQKDSDNNITAYIQLFKKTSKSTKQYVINTCTVSSEDLGDDVYFGASYTNGKTTIK